MAKSSLINAALPSEPELRSFASAAAHLLIQRPMHAAGIRTVSRRPGVGLQPLDHRDYAPGDEVRHIDWRLSARRRLPVVRRFESESMTDWTLLIDASSSMAASGGAKWRSAVRVTAAMSYALLQLGHRVGVLVFGERVLASCPRGRGQPHYAAIARLLAVLQPAPAGETSDLGACASHLHGATSVFAFSDFLADDEMCRDLTAIAQHCKALHVMQLSDDAETQLRVSGDFDLVDVETGARMALRPGPHADALAARERAAMTARLRRFCARSGVAFTDWDISLSWQHILLAHLIRARSHC